MESISLVWRHFKRKSVRMSQIDLTRKLFLRTACVFPQNQAAATLETAAQDTLAVHLPTMDLVEIAQAQASLYKCDCFIFCISSWLRALSQANLWRT